MEFVEDRKQAGLIVLVVILTVLIFAIDLNTPSGIASGVPYIILVFIGMWLRKRYHVYFLAVLGSVLTVIGFFWSSEGGVLWMVLFNRGLALFAIWVTAFLLIRIKKGHEHIEKLARTDHLTGLCNRLNIDAILNREVERSKRYERPLSIIMFDLDHFKDVNDMYGHLAGDQVLCAFAQVARSKLRSADTLGRWGGEEFLIVCPDTDLQGAVHLAERLRSAFDISDFPHVGQQTASFGVATFHPDESEVAFIKRADETLYSAKNAGRNRIVPPPLP